MRRLAPLLAVLAVLAVLPACDSGADAVGLTGTWEGQISTPSSAQIDVELRLTDNGRVVSGTGTVSGSGAPFRFAITDGSFVGTSVTLPFMFSETPFQGSLAGTLVDRDPGRIEGTFTGPSVLTGPVRIELVAR